ncbi:MAG: hypothetical protein RL058_698 [Actinomycetota bacterium]
MGAVTVTEETIEDFRRDGATVLRGAVSEEHLTLLAAGVERNRQSPSPNAHWYTDPSSAVGFWSDYVTWRSVPEYEQIVRAGSLAAAAAALMASRTARFFHEHVLIKEAGATERTPWHHDQPYYCVDGDQNVSMWIALDPVPESSALRFIAGSHRWNRWFIPRRFIDHAPYGTADHRYEQLPDRFVGSDGELDGETVISLPVEPGDVVCFHFRTLHGAPGNPNATARRAVSLRWVGDDAVWAERPWPVSPTFESEGLEVGDSLDDERFPVIHP